MFPRHEILIHHQLISSQSNNFFSFFIVKAGLQRVDVGNRLRGGTSSHCILVGTANQNWKRYANPFLHFQIASTFNIFLRLQLM